MKSLTPTELSVFEFIKLIALIALSASVTVAFPLVNSATGIINWQDVAFSSLAIFLLVIIFVALEYFKQSIQAKLIVAEKSGQPTLALQEQLAIITAVEGSIGQIVEHTKVLSTLIPNITSLVNIAQQTATSSLQQVQQTQTTIGPAQVLSTFPPVPQQAAVSVVAPVSTSAYDTSAVSSTTGVMPTVSAPST